MMQVFGSKECVHCRSVINLLAMKGISFEFIELKEETDEVRAVDGGISYSGLNAVVDMIYRNYGGG